MNGAGGPVYEVLHLTKVATWSARIKGSRIRPFKLRRREEEAPALSVEVLGLVRACTVG